MVRTLKNAVSYTSVGLMTGVDCTAELKPSDIPGIRYHFGGGIIEAKSENVVATDHCVVLGAGELKIVLTEHFSAACAICGIEALDIYLSHYEMPIGDGSAKPWVDLFRQVGTTESVEESYIITEPFSYLNGKTHCIVLPSDRLSITYSVNYNHPDLRNRWVSLKPENIDEIVEARTFGYLKEFEMIKAAGFAKGADVGNTVGLTEDGYTTELRSEFEPAKHKILDLLGDFYLSGYNPLKWKAEITVKEAGHAVHIKTIKMSEGKIKKEQ